MVSALEDEKKIVARLAAARQSLGLSYGDVAARTGLHYTAVSLIERGKRHITLLVFLKLCAALGLGPEALFGSVVSDASTHASRKATAALGLHEKIRPLPKK